MGVSVLIVGVDERTGKVFEGLCARAGFRALPAADVEAALSHLRRHVVDAAVIGPALPTQNRIALADAAIAKDKNAAIIVLAKTDGAPTLAKGFLKGVYLIAEKPLKEEEIMEMVKTGLRHRQLSATLEAVEKDASARNRYLVKDSTYTRDIYALIESIARTPHTPALIIGEPGTGKETVAREIHTRSARGDGPFVVFDCAVYASPYLETELFGRGTTDGQPEKRGAFECADGGSLFLLGLPRADESTQLKILRAITDRVVRRAGENDDTAVDVRVVAATESGPEETGLVHPQLLHHLNVFTLRIPPLRERKDDIILLAKHYLDLFRQEFNKPVTTLAIEAEDILLDYPWPGNVRELRNVIERGVILSKGRLLQPAAITISALGEASGPDITKLTPIPDMPLAEAEKRHILAIIAKVYGNRSQAAKILGISRTTLWSKLKEYGVS